MRGVGVGVSFLWLVDFTHTCMSHKTQIAVAGEQHGYNLSLRSGASHRAYLFLYF